MAQIGYVTIGTNDLASAVAFYDALLGELGATRFIETDQGISWSFGSGTTSLAVMEPFDGAPATIGNGVIIALGMPTRKRVDSTHAKAPQLGAINEGTPGPRGVSGYYAGYSRDRDGNKLNVFCIERVVGR